MALPPNPMNQKQEILVDLEDLERSELSSLRKQALGCGIASIVGALTCWSPFITPWVTGFITVPTCYVAHMRMQDVTKLLQGESCFCQCCGPNPRNTLKTCRPMAIGCCVLAVLSVVTQIAYLAEYGENNSISGIVGIIGVLCLLVMIALAFALGFFAYNFKKVIMIFDSVTARQHLKQTELSGVAGVINNAVGQVQGMFGKATQGGQQQQPAQAQPVQYNNNQQQPQQQQPQYGQQQPQQGGQPQYQV